MKNTHKNYLKALIEVFEKLTQAASQQELTATFESLKYKEDFGCDKNGDPSEKYQQADDFMLLRTLFEIEFRKDPHTISHDLNIHDDLWEVLGI